MKPQLLDKNETNLLIINERGNPENVTLSPLNRLLFEHDLWGVLRSGDELLELKGRKKQSSVTIVPYEDGNEFDLKVGDYEALHIGSHQRTDLVEALMKVYEDETPGKRDVKPLIDLWENIRENRVRTSVVNKFAEQFSERVEVRDDGWLINGSLLLTWEQEFYHPNTTTRRVSGSSVTEGESEPAYEVSINNPESTIDREVAIDGTEYRLTNNEMQFLARALWGMAAEKGGENK